MHIHIYKLFYKNQYESLILTQQDQMTPTHLTYILKEKKDHFTSDEKY